MELQSAKEKFEAQGIQLAAISYDSPEILKDFADRHKIEFPLLADPQSKIIADYGVHIDANGIIRERYFETKYTDRFTANNVMGEAISGAWRRGQPKSRGPASRHRARPIGSRCRSRQPLRPGGADRASTGCSRLRTRRQGLQADFLYLDAIKEQVPVFEGRFRITSEVKMSANPDFMKSLGADGKTITIAGQLHYQACDKTTCFLPTSIPVAWQLQILPLDRQRSPEAIQHK